MTEVEAQKVVTMLVTAYPVSLSKLDRDQQADTRRVYREMIIDVDAEHATAAVRGLIATSKFLPTIAELREACMNAKHGRRRPGGDAWGDVVHAMKRYGYTRTPGVDFQFEDPLVARVVDAFGWRELCGSSGVGVTADRARFIELYEHLVADVRGNAQIAPGMELQELPVRSATRQLAARPFAELIAESSIGRGVQNIRDNGVDAETDDLLEEMEHADV